ncbi:uncharacterized protein B0T15DRAFT_530089 [Chaetomium strumarium]|uniref:Uncharacterized protein n=1 Tax=Chaetomium strumarium TaxID=1170767 RepID=A0AAJ0GWE5_9PEZI|nr:hypothetical protein B0T15DRAFT_530089 [Chaetomium strumarium]
MVCVTLLGCSAARPLLCYLGRHIQCQDDLVISGHRGYIFLFFSVALVLFSCFINPRSIVIHATTTAHLHARFRVCSAAMRRASPVWKSMLFGPWKEAKPAQGDWIVDLPEDKPWPLAMAHGIFEKIPKYLSLQELNELLIHTENYDLIHLPATMGRHLARDRQGPDVPLAELGSPQDVNTS